MNGPVHYLLIWFWDTILFFCLIPPPPLIMYSSSVVVLAIRGNNFDFFSKLIFYTANMLDYSVTWFCCILCESPYHMQQQKNFLPFLYTFTCLSFIYMITSTMLHDSIDKEPLAMSCISNIKEIPLKHM